MSRQDCLPSPSRCHCRWIQARWRRKRSVALFRRVGRFLVAVQVAQGGALRQRCALHLRCWRRHTSIRVVRGFLGTYIRDASKLSLLARKFCARVRAVQRYCRGYVAVLRTRRALVRGLWEEEEGALLQEEHAAAMKRLARRAKRDEAMKRHREERGGGSGGQGRRATVARKPALPGMASAAAQRGGAALLAQVQSHSELAMKGWLETDVKLEKLLAGQVYIFRRGRIRIARLHNDESPSHAARRSFPGRSPASERLRCVPSHERCDAAPKILLRPGDFFFRGVPLCVGCPQQQRSSHAHAGAGRIRHS